MKYFIKSLILFILFAVIVFGCLLVSLVLRSENYLSSEFRLRAKTTVISISHSHLECAIDPAIWPEYQDFCTPGSPPWFWLMKLQEITKRNPGKLPKIVLIACSVQDMNLGGREELERDYFSIYLPMSLQHVSLWPYGRSSLKVDDVICTLIQKAVKVKFDNYIEHAPENMESLFIKDRGNEFLKKQFNLHFNNQRPSFHNSEEIYSETLSAIIDTAEKNKMEVVMILAPYHAKYRAMVPEKHVKKLKTVVDYLIKKHRIRFLDYWKLPLEDVDFRDGDHLSNTGRQKFTRILMSDLGFPAPPAGDGKE